MKTNLSTPRTAPIGGVSARAFWPLLGLAAVSIVVATGFFFWPAKGEHATASKPEAEPPAARSADGVVRLTPAKLQAAALHASEVEAREIRDSRRVPGKIGYNASRRLEIKVPAAGAVTHVLVLPGQAVKRGDRLALLNSVDVGMAREEVVHAEADLHIAERETDWLAQIAHNTQALLKALEDFPDVMKVEVQFEDQVLGDQREKIIAAYSKLRLATRASAAAVSAQDALSERYVQERASAREIADANYRSTCEKASFDARQQLARSQANLEHARHMLVVSRQKLKLLLGPFAEISSEHDDETLCELILCSPLDGKVEDRFVSDGAQFVASQALFALANTDTLWVSAQIYEREWAALAGGDVQEVNVESPALPGYRVTAKVQFFSVGVSSETRAVPLVAELPNTESRLKPGMFAWVDVPLGPPHKALVVPAGAIMRHEQETFVFVEERPGEYRKVDVTPGLETSEFVEVLSGLDAGAKVVDRGAFFLKSELLLEGEEP
ncbi:MAG TPA: efflux RND transporter periplasmic adaptor subunit [Pirellulales bacterium]|nr:efflux RND transporter periplasmic adaptor subunit [Pirellulales bacterium]